MSLLVQHGVHPLGRRSQVDQDAHVTGTVHVLAEGGRFNLETREAAVVEHQGFVSIQVNVDGEGRNMVGDAANEPSIAVDLNDPRRIAIGWRQFDSILSPFIIMTSVILSLIGVFLGLLVTETPFCIIIT